MFSNDVWILLILAGTILYLCVEMACSIYKQRGGRRPRKFLTRVEVEASDDEVVIGKKEDGEDASLYASQTYTTWHDTADTCT